MCCLWMYQYKDQCLKSSNLKQQITKANLILLLADNDPFTNHSGCPGYRSSENSSDQLAMVVAVQAGTFRIGILFAVVDMFSGKKIGP
ncbi:hypothetical protein Tco_0725112 [Tanacetum coccineum]|uniref:Uncharacterized protein n=1 Tax=Tanacetum coccineum TaxID=301880 RepID=A0ABQ4YD09_9ASTR